MMPNSQTQMAFLITTLLGFAKTTATSDTISDEYEMREAFDTPLIDSFFHIMPKYDYSQSVSDFVLDYCLSAMDDKTNTGTRLPVFIEFLLRRLQIIKIYERKNKTPEYLRRSYNTLIARLWASSKGMMHLTSLRQFYSNDQLPFMTWASLCKMFDQNKVLRKHLQIKYAEIYRMNASMSRFYRYSDRFTGLLTFANANDCKIELILRFLQSFYETFFEIVEKAHKDFLISKNDDVCTDFDDLLSKFDTERLHLRKNSFAKINFSIQTIRNLSYAYFIFQVILYNQRPRASSLNIKYILNDFNYSLDQYNMNHKAPLAKQNKASLEALNLHYAKFKGKETDILADYFAYHGTIISLTEKEKTDEEIILKFDRIVANYEKTIINK